MTKKQKQKTNNKKTPKKQTKKTPENNNSQKSPAKKQSSKHSNLCRDVPRRRVQWPPACFLGLTCEQILLHLKAKREGDLNNTTLDGLKDPNSEASLGSAMTT